MEQGDSLLAAALQSVHILDRTEELDSLDALYAFALDELLCRQIGRGGPPICHLWRHSGAFIMGLRDSRLPAASAGMQMLEERGWRTAVRHSGGAAVPLDPGVVNVSLILPMHAVEKADYKQDFELMYQLIRQAVRTQCELAGKPIEVDVAKGEIAGAYCPGDYDLSLSGFKFCGIAQRRQSHAFIVQAFIVADGSGPARASLVRQFYDLASEDASFDQYPLVIPDSMRSLSELLPVDAGGVRVFVEAVKHCIRSYQTDSAFSIPAGVWAMPEPNAIEAMIVQLRERYSIPNI